MILKKKLKRVNKVLLSIYLLGSIIFLIGLVLLTINLSYLKGIETFYRILSLCVLYIILIFYLLYGFVWLFNKKKIKLITYSIFILLLSGVVYFGNYYINKTYKIIDSINKNEIVYTTNLIVLKGESIKNKDTEKVGMISNENDIAGYKLAKELIIKEKLDKIEIVYYEDYYEMLDDLNNKVIQGMFISSNYETLFVEEDTYSSISNNTVVYKSLSKTIKKENETISTKKITEPFTVLLLGIDSTLNDLKKNDAFRGDSIMLITFNPKTLSSTFLSIPRDTYVPITCRNNREMKINASAVSGTKCMIETITNFTGIKIDYFVKLNFTGLVDFVNAVGGIEVNVPYSFCEQNSKRNWGEDTVFVKEGLQKLNGEQALALSRNRHFPNDAGAGEMRKQCPQYNKGPRNDFIRGQNQQLVVQGLINKAKTIRNIDAFYKLLNSLSDNMDTNMQTEEMLSFYEVGKNILFNSNQGVTEAIRVEKLYLQTSNLIIHKVGSAEIYQKKSLEAIVKEMKLNLGLIKVQPIKTFSYDANKEVEEVVIGKGLYDSVRRTTVPNFVGTNKNTAVSWANTNGKTIKVIEVGSESKLYNEELESNTIVAQSITPGTVTDQITSLEITVQIK